MKGTGDGGKVDSTLALANQVTRPLITLLLVATFCYGFIAGKVTGETFVIIVTSAVSFWFAVQRTQGQRADDKSDPVGIDPSATVSAPPGGGTATATVTSPKQRSRP